MADASAFEPTLGITPEGVAFYQAVRPGTLVPQVFRSGDLGATWDDVSALIETPLADAPIVGGVHAQPFSFDPFVRVDPDTGRVFALNLVPNQACVYPSCSAPAALTDRTSPSVVSVKYIMGMLSYSVR